VGNEAKDDPSKDFLAVNGTRTVHEASKPADYLMMTMV
jgi:hypothetical protein